MAELIIVIDISEIVDGKMEELKAAIAELAEFVDENEPRAIAYHVYLDEQSETMTVLQIHEDSGSMEFHMNVAGSKFAAFADLVKLRSIDVYGKPSEELLKLLRKKSELLGNAPLQVHDLDAGFTRL